MKEAVFHPEARAEASESVEFYEGRLKGLGARFLSAVEQTAERISASPEAGTPLAGGFRRRIVPGFPYSILYRVWEDYVYLVAVAHQHRRPDYWRQRADRRLNQRVEPTGMSFVLTRKLCWAGGSRALR